MHLSIRRTSLTLLLTLAIGAALAAAQPISLQVDLTDAPRRIFHGRLSVPVSPGPLTLFYPEWIPGEHGPTGPISDLVGIRMTAAGRPLAWERDPLELYSFRVVIPEGADRLDIELDYLSPSAGGKFTHGPATSDRLAMLSWNTLLLYPEGRPADEILFSPSLLLPPGWSYGTALQAASRQGDTVTFEPVSLVTLIDSPVAAGRHHRVFDLTGSAPVPHRLHVVADSEEALGMSPETQEAYGRLRLCTSTSSKPPCSRMICRWRGQASCRTSSSTPGTASIGAPPASPAPPTRSPSWMTCCGSTRA